MVNSFIFNIGIVVLLGTNVLLQKMNMLTSYLEHWHVLLVVRKDIKCICTLIVVVMVVSLMVCKTEH